MKQWRAVLPHRRGCRWGVTGMPLAVPITAVLRKLPPLAQQATCGAAAARWRGGGSAAGAAAALG